MIVRIYTGDDGQCHFEDLDTPTEPIQRVATKTGEDLVFRRSTVDSFSDWHNPSRRQYLFIIDGRMEVSPMESGLAEDMTGQGHVTKSIGGSYASVSMGIPD